ncbi:MAG: hypothetical protein JSS62_05315, partial [Verrucomicrobia bacterium]|nr:hypothetical protein [Verrucomicrobiota bacterium]
QGILLRAPALGVMTAVGGLTLIVLTVKAVMSYRARSQQPFYTSTFSYQSKATSLHSQSLFSSSFQNSPSLGSLTSQGSLSPNLYDPANFHRDHASFPWVCNAQIGDLSIGEPCFTDIPLNTCKIFQFLTHHNDRAKYSYPDDLVIFVMNAARQGESTVLACSPIVKQNQLEDFKAACAAASIAVLPSPDTLPIVKVNLSDTTPETAYWRSLFTSRGQPQPTALWSKFEKKGTAE